MSAEPKTEPTAVALIQPRTAGLSWLPHRDSEAATSIDRSTKEGRILLFNALQGEAMQLGELLGEIITVHHVLVHPAQSRDEDTGGYKSYLRVVMIGPEGELVSCGSEGILEALGRLAWSFGPPPWSPPMIFKAKQIQSGKNRRYTIELQPESVR